MKTDVIQLPDMGLDPSGAGVKREDPSGPPPHPTQLSGRLGLLAVVGLLSSLTACGQTPLDEGAFLYATADALKNASDAVVDGQGEDTGDGVGIADTAADVPDVPSSADVGGPETTDAGVEPECFSDFDCLDLKGKTPCKVPSCSKGACELKQLDQGVKCTNPLLSLEECQQTRCDDAGGCVAVPKPDTESCGFGICGKMCKSGVCVVAVESDYDDGNPCTKDFCKQGAAVVHEPLTDLSLSCDDGDLCTGSEYCASGKCLGMPVDCSDGLNCTLDACEKASGCMHTPDVKQCDDGDPCTKDACDLAEGCTVVGGNVGAECSDTNACTKDDACDADGACVGTAACPCTKDADCDSKNACIPLACVDQLCQVDPGKTVDCDPSQDSACFKNTCIPADGVCKMQPIAQDLVCDDGNPCTTASTCKDGQCVGSGTLDCDDQNQCTKDACSPIEGCVHALVAGACDDGNPCTLGDQCDAAGCGGEAIDCDDGISCTLDDCDKVNGKCTHTAQDAQCDDSNPCTTDTCDVSGKACVHAPAAAAVCDDGDSCTDTKCVKGSCVVDKYKCQCKTHEDCDDKNPCTTDTCAGGSCSAVAVKDGEACDTNSKCNLAGTGTCAVGVCTGGKAIDCSQGLGPCVIGACNPATGKCETVSKADGTSCDADGKACTEKDACLEGKCLAGNEVDCAGLDEACTKGTCQEDGPGKFVCKAVPLAKGVACEDGNFCTVLNKCDGEGKCGGGSLRTCSEFADVCNKGSCDATAGQCKKVPLPVSVKCDDGQYCTENDHCDDNGVCVGGTPMVCAGDDCLPGQCDEAGDKCAKTPAAAGVLCDDGDFCTAADTCDGAGKCKGGNLKTCEGDDCNLASCDPKTGDCVKKADKDGKSCSDGDACTTVDTCKGGKCEGGTPKKCDDAPCKIGVCNSPLGTCGLKAAPANTACDDGNACTEKDSCQDGKCIAGDYGCDCSQDIDCDDKNTCTTDECATVSGKKSCKNTVKVGSTCDDGDPCTQNDNCSAAGSCAGTALVCDDKEACTADACDPKKGECVFLPQTGQSCDDGEPCTTSDKCNTGKCAGTAIVCNDGNPCTKDACASAKCQYTAQTGGSCDDGKLCTTDDTCASGKCTGKTKDCDDGNYCTTDTCDTTKGCQHAAVSAGSSCGSGKVCSGTTCTCQYGMDQSGTTEHEMFYDIQPTSSGGAIAVGRRYKSGSGYEGFCKSFNSLPGTKRAEANIDATTKDDQLKAIAEISTGNYVAVGQRAKSNTDGEIVGWAVKLDADCKVKDTKTFTKGKGERYFRAVAARSGGGAWLVGSYKEEGQSLPPFPPMPSAWHGWVSRVDGNLSGTSHTTFGAPGHKTYLDDVVETAGKAALVVGRTDDKTAGGEDGFAAMVAADGSISWTKTYGSNESDYFWAVALDGNYGWFVGRSQVSKATLGAQIWVVKADITKNGETVFGKTMGSDKDDWANDIAISGGTRVLVGRTYADGKTQGTGQVLLLSSAGTISKTLTFTNTAGTADLDGIAIMPDGRVLVGGQVYDNSTKKQNPWWGYLGKTLESSCN